MLHRKTRAQVIQGAIQSLQNQGVVTNLNPGGVARSLVEVTAGQVAELYDVLAANEVMRYPSTAVGVYLDLIGESFGLTRGSPGTSEASATDKNIKFYVTSGTLIDFIPNSNIPVLTQIKSSDGSIVYQVTERAFFGAGDTEVWVSAEALSAGSDSNIAPGILITHTMGPTQVLVTNRFAISSGSDVEDDESYRFRISNAWLTLQTANPTALRAAILSIPDVAEVRIQEFSRGIGTYEILIVPRESSVSASVLRHAASVLDRVRAAGVRTFVRQPDYSPFEITLRLQFIRGTTETEKNRLRSTTRRVVADYIGDIRLGGSLVINELRQRVMQISDQIFDMSIECLAINRRPQLLVNYRLAEDELLVLDPSSSDPILVL